MAARASGSARQYLLLVAVLPMNVVACGGNEGQRSAVTATTSTTSTTTTTRASEPRQPESTTTTTPEAEVGEILYRTQDTGCELYLLPERRAAEVCTSDTAATSMALVDVESGDELWTQRLPTDSEWGLGSRHLFVVTASQVPASGLQDEYTSFEVAAYDLDSGDLSWTSPLEDFIDEDERSSECSLVVSEPPSANLAAWDGVYISCEASTLFDAETGEVLWTYEYNYRSLASGWYMGYGIAVVDGYEANDYGSGRTGRDASTGEVVWDLTIEDLELNSGQDGADYVDDQGVLWDFGSAGHVAIDLRTGEVRSEVRYPEHISTGEVLADTDHVVVSDREAEELEAYATSDLSTPLWTVPADGTNLQMLSKTHVAVDGPTGSILLSLEDGSIVGELPGFVNSPFAVDGLAVVEGQVVLVESPR